MKTKPNLICGPCSQGRHADAKFAYCPDRRCGCACRAARPVKTARMVDMLFMLDALPKETLKAMGKPLQKYIFELEHAADELRRLKVPHKKHVEFTLGCEQCLRACVNQLTSQRDLKNRLREIAKLMRAHHARITVTSGTRWVLNLIESAADLRLKDWRERGERPLQRRAR